MKTDEELSQRLQAWKVQPGIPARFQASVWDRIRAQEEAAAQTTIARLWHWLFPTVPALRWATAVAVAMLAIGSGLGGIAAQSTNERIERGLAQSYIATVDPYLHGAHAHQTP